MSSRATRTLALALAVAGALALAMALALPSPASAGGGVVWLCKPGQASNPCAPSLRTTRFSPGGRRLGVDDVRRAAKPAYDCFYVYPTVSEDDRQLADRSVDPELRSIALYQAARFSRDCRVFAPVYRQITLDGLFSGGLNRANADIAYRDVRAAWRSYLRRDNKGRGVVLLGHSQGTHMLRRLVGEEIDGNAAVRRRLISAVLLGGNVTVRDGADTGGDFHRIRACRAAGQTGCVIAFSTFNATPPDNAVFGRPSGIDPLWGIERPADVEVLCTNPASLRRGSGRVTPTFPTAPFAPGRIAAGIGLTGFELPEASTAWASFPRSFSAACSSANGANVLRVRSVAGAPRLNPAPSADWGLHLTDMNIALGELADVVRAQADAHLAER